VRIWGEAQDKDEIYNQILERGDINVTKIFAEIIDPPLILSITTGLLSILKLIYDYYKNKNKNKIKITFDLPDGRLITIDSKNFEELNVIIDELETDDA